MNEGKPRRRRSTTRGALVAIACLLVASAAFRIVSGSGTAVAREMGELRADTSGDSAEGISEAALDQLLAILQERESLVEREEKELAERRQSIQRAEARMADTLRQLEEAEAALRATMALADSAAENDLAQLTSVYENMKPQQAAPLFDRMTPAFAAGFLGRMRPEAAAAILSGLEPEAAYAISVILAGRNADVPRADR